jgi:hypothetical protein
MKQAKKEGRKCVQKKLSDKFGEAIPVGIDDVMVEYCIGGPSLVLCSLEPMLCSSINIGKKKEEKSMSQKASTAVFFQRHAGIYGQVMT